MSLMVGGASRVVGIEVLPMRNCWDPRTWRGEGVASRHSLVAKDAMANGRAKRVTDPTQITSLEAAAREVAGVKLNPPYYADNDQEMFVVGGRVFIRVIGFAGPAHAEWFEAPVPRTLLNDA